MPDHKRPAPAAVPIHDLISHRWSPRAFDAKSVEKEKLRGVFEAARWAASSYNAQPWYFIVATKDDPENYAKVLSTFVEFNQSWAKNAPVVALSVAFLSASQDIVIDAYRVDTIPASQAFRPVATSTCRTMARRIAMRFTTSARPPRLSRSKQHRSACKSIRWPESIPKRRAKYSTFPKTSKPSRASRSAIRATT